MTYNAIRRTRCKKTKPKTGSQDLRITVLIGLCGISAAPLTYVSHAICSFGDRLASFFFFVVEGQAGMWVKKDQFVVSVAASEHNKLSEFQFDQSRLNAAEDLSCHLGLF